MSTDYFLELKRNQVYSIKLGLGSWKYEQFHVVDSAGHPVLEILTGASMLAGASRFCRPGQLEEPLFQMSYNQHVVRYSLDLARPDGSLIARYSQIFRSPFPRNEWTIYNADGQEIGVTGPEFTGLKALVQSCWLRKPRILVRQGDEVLAGSRWGYMNVDFEVYSDKIDPVAVLGAMYLTRIYASG